jgi:hypothetical protein
MRCISGSRPRYETAHLALRNEDAYTTQKYLEAIKIKKGSPITRSIDQMCSALYAGNKSEDWHIVQTIRKVYLCPRQIAVHKGHPELCGGACHRRQAENVVVYEDQACLLVVSMEKEIVLDDKVCRVE